MVHHGFDDLVVLAVGHQHLGQRAGFHGMAVVARGLKPGVAVRVTHLGEGGLGFALIGGAGGFAFVPAVADVFGDLGGVEALHVTDFAIIDDAGPVPALVEVALAAGEGEFAKGHEVGGAADACPVFVRTGYHEQVGNVDLFHKGAGLLVQFAEFFDTFGLEGVVAGHAAAHGKLGVGVFGAEHGHAAGHIHLHAPGLQGSGPWPTRLASGSR